MFDGDEELAARRKIQGGNLAKNIENICTKILFRFDDVSLEVSLSGFSYLVDQLGDSKVAFSRKMLECIKKSKHRLESNNVISHAFNGAMPSTTASMYSRLRPRHLIWCRVLFLKFISMNPTLMESFDFLQNVAQLSQTLTMRSSK